MIKSIFNWKKWDSWLEMWKSPNKAIFWSKSDANLEELDEEISYKQLHDQ